MIATHMRRIVSQLVNSKLDTTRIHWRTWVGMPPELINSPDLVELVWDNPDPLSTIPSHAPCT